MTSKTAFYKGRDTYRISPSIDWCDTVKVLVVRDSERAWTALYGVGEPKPLAWVDGEVTSDEALTELGYRTIYPSVPKSVSGMVREFHEIFGHPVANEPALIDDARSALRVNLINEEFNEFMEAVIADDLVEIADALGDMVYVIYGAALEYGIPLDNVVREIHRSNLSKLGENGEPMYRESDNKIMKGPNFEEPDIEAAMNG